MWLSCWLFLALASHLDEIFALPTSHAVNPPLARTEGHEEKLLLHGDSLSTLALTRRELLQPKGAHAEHADAVPPPRAGIDVQERMTPAVPLSYLARRPARGARQRHSQRKVVRRGPTSLQPTVSPKSIPASVQWGSAGSAARAYVVTNQDQAPAGVTAMPSSAEVSVTPAPMVIGVTATTSGGYVAYNVSYDDAEADVPHRISMSTLVCIIFSGTALALWIAWRNLKKVYESRRENDIFADMLGGLGDESTQQRASKLWGTVRGVAFTLLTGESDSGQTDKDTKEDSSAKEENLFKLEAKFESSSSAKEENVSKAEEKFESAGVGFATSGVEKDAAPGRDSVVGAADVAAGGAPEAAPLPAAVAGTTRERRGRSSKARRTSESLESLAAAEALMQAEGSGSAAAAAAGGRDAAVDRERRSRAAAKDTSPPDKGAGRDDNEDIVDL
mmetsp:Transcript_160400/g.292962  ORF Transcript_160400/g.292962 Transcript_160400/m.292962 type:complete len:446 (+) Transcript_160400:109-1446(+)